MNNEFRDTKRAPLLAAEAHRPSSHQLSCTEDMIEIAVSRSRSASLMAHEVHPLLEPGTEDSPQESEDAQRGLKQAIFVLMCFLSFTF